MITTDDYWTIAKNLRNHYELFYTCWSLGRPVINNEIPTAGVAFSTDNGEYLSFQFNENFFNELNDYERAFVVAHEALHVIHNHGKRFSGKNARIANIAADLVINYALTTKYGFDRDKFEHKNLKGACWFDNIFPDNPAIPKNKNFEYYYDLLVENGDNGSGGEVIDSHEGLEGATLDNILEAIEKMASTGLSDKEKSLLDGVGKILGEQSADGKKAGVESSTIQRIVQATYNPKALWVKVIKDMRSAFRLRENEKDSWLMKERRHSLLNDDLILPCRRIQTAKNKLELAIFMDVSGSCIHLVDQFYKIVNSVPLDIFDVKAHVFDTSVRPVELGKDKIHAGGGTCFITIERYIQENFVKYPYAVMVITDGEGNNVKPQHPKRWRWVLEGNHRDCIPEESTVISIGDFK